MGEIHRIQMSDALFNASILGFMRVLKLDREDSEIDKSKNYLEINSDSLEGFGQKYLDALIYHFEELSALKAIIRRSSDMSSELLELKRIGKDVGAESSFCLKTQAFVDVVINKFSSASYKSAVAILKVRGIDFPLEEKVAHLKALKKAKNCEAILKEVEEIVDSMKSSGGEIYRTFVLKDIIYNQVNRFWENLAFLNTQKSKSDYIPLFDTAFTESAVAFKKTEGKAAKLSCTQCGVGMKKSDSSGMAWLCDLGIDHNRKQSHYWNLSADVLICPVCKLVYSCLPLGFQMVGSNGIFVNSDTLKKLEEANDYNPKESQEQRGNSLYYSALRNIILTYQKEANQSYLGNFQLIYRYKNRYRIHDYSRERIKLLSSSNEMLEKMQWTWFKYNDQSYSVFEETINRIMNNERLDELIDLLIRLILRDESRGFRTLQVKDLIKLNSDFYLSRGGRMNKEEVRVGMTGKGSVGHSLVDKAYHAGAELSKAILSLRQKTNSAEQTSMTEGASDNKLRGLCYRLLNAVSIGDASTFIDAVARHYLAMNHEIPSFLLKAIKNEDDFTRIGQAFVLGLCVPNKSEQTDGNDGAAQESAGQNA